ncbi:hypothetical protein B0J11DRAFT_580311 [Dendryphion nanum]|uniref:Uncharacterized protein n=1 Tax=Dendryphion nanum TaxID=256645 RepID=A0A9P9DMQ6_9PLEO|nr:hypothetical protein B0J11DRAFT_580311 [Dendryphion nanum]
MELYQSGSAAGVQGTLQAYERSLKRRNVCIGGLIFTWTLSIASISYGVHAVTTYPASVEVDKHVSVGLSFITNVIITVCSAMMGSIQSATLRSALLREGRLEFNSNIRFFKRSAKCWPHGALANTLTLFFLVLSYASVSQAWTPDSYGFSLVANGVPFLTLGSGLGGQAAMTSWCLYSVNVPTWSSNPINTALVALHHGHQRISGRAMLGVESVGKPSIPSKPRSEQAKARNVVPVVKRLDRIVLIFGILAPILSGIYIAVCSSLDVELWILLPSNNGDFSTDKIPQTEFLGFIFAICALQSIFTIATLVLEYQILVTNDERTWRRLGRKDGISLSEQTTFSALKNPFLIFLYLFQALVHWLFGLGISVSFGSGFNLAPANFMSCIIAFLWLMAIARLGNQWKPQGPLPATYGHVQTILNLVDVWGYHLWWGDKGALSDDSAVRKAGTATSILESINMDCEYQ